MPTVTYSLSFVNNPQLAISPQDLIRQMLYGVKLCAPSGQQLLEQDVLTFIVSAQEQVERFLGLKLFKQVFSEDLDFYKDDWYQFGKVGTSYPARKCFELNGFIGTVRQIQYPAQWLVTKTSSDHKLFRRSIWLVPNQGGQVNQNSVVFSGITPHLGFLGMHTIPNYWRATYLTGFDTIPEDIVKAISYLAVIPIYMFLSNGIIKPGLSSQSLSIDGLSQTLSIEAGGYTTRLKQINDVLIGTPQSKGLLPVLRNYYNDYTFTVA